MRKNSVVVFSILVIGMCTLVLSSCNKDDEPTKYQLSFTESSLTVDEAEGYLEVELTLSKPAPKDITIEYSLSGTAYDDVRAGEDYYPDFEIDGDYGELTIEEGETTGVIALAVYTDDLLENDESIIITIDDVDATNVEYDGDDATVTLTQEDGMLVLLEWPAPGLDGVADMDLFVRLGETAANPVWDGILSASAYRGFDSNYEFVFLPKTYTGELFGLDYTNSTYGLSYTYYNGNLNPLNFTVTFMEFTNGDFEAEANYNVFENTYTLDNINTWVNSAPPTIIAQTFVNNDGTFSAISALTTQAESSRTAEASLNTLLHPKYSKKAFSRNVTFGNSLPLKLKDRLK